MPKSLSNTELIDRFHRVHNSYYDYSKISYINIHTKIVIMCPIHGEFRQTPASHANGQGCRKCAPRKSTSLSQFLARAKKRHNNKYDYSLVKYKTLKDLVTIVCPIHGNFQQTPNNHFKYGCNLCAQEFRNTKQRRTLAEFIEKAEVIHHKKYDYSKSIYKNNIEKLIIICSKHGEFFQSPHQHLAGHGCPLCIRKVSLKEKAWLDKLKIPIENRYKKIIVGNRFFYADGFDPKTNTIYEFNGDFWHGNPKKFPAEKWNSKTNCTFGDLYKNTLEKKRLLELAGFTVIDIWESEFNS